MTTAVSTPTADRLRGMAITRVDMALDEVQYMLHSGGQFDLPSMKAVKAPLVAAYDVLTDVSSDLHIETVIGHEMIIRLNYASLSVQRALLSSRCTRRDKEALGTLRSIIDQAVGLVEALLLVAAQD